MSPLEERVELKSLISESLASLFRDKLAQHIPGTFHVEGFISVSIVSDADHIIVVSIKETIHGSNEVPPVNQGDNTVNLESGSTKQADANVSVTTTMSHCVDEEADDFQHGTHIIEFEYTNEPGNKADNTIKLEHNGNDDCQSRKETLAADFITQTGNGRDNTGSLDHNHKVQNQTKEAQAEKHTLTTRECEVRLDSMLVDHYFSRSNSVSGHNRHKEIDLSDNMTLSHSAGAASIGKKSKTSNDLNGNKKHKKGADLNSNKKRLSEGTSIDALADESASLQDLVIRSGEEQNSVITADSSIDSNNTCRQCGKCFKYKQTLVKHLKSGERMMCANRCSECGKCFRNNVDLKIHFRTHTGERPYGCEECGKWFAINQVLKRHLIIHSGEKPFHCVECKKKYNNPSSLTRHMKKHTGNRPYKCQQCLKSFCFMGHLKQHLRSHSDQKPFVCVECGKCLKKK